MLWDADEVKSVRRKRDNTISMARLLALRNGFPSRSKSVPTELERDLVLTLGESRISFREEETDAKVWDS